MHSLAVSAPLSHSRTRSVTPHYDRRSPSHPNFGTHVRIERGLPPALHANPSTLGGNRPSVIELSRDLPPGQYRVFVTAAPRTTLPVLRCVAYPVADTRWTAIRLSVNARYSEPRRMFGVQPPLRVVIFTTAIADMLRLKSRQVVVDIVYGAQLVASVPFELAPVKWWYGPNALS